MLPLQDVFDECEDRGIIVSFNEFCCSSCAVHESTNLFEKRPECYGFVECNRQSVDNCMLKLLYDKEKESAFMFGFIAKNYGKYNTKTKEVGYALASILKKKGYKIEWNETADQKITAVVSLDNCSHEFIDKWVKDEEDAEKKLSNEEGVDSSILTRIRMAAIKMNKELF